MLELVWTVIPAIVLTYLIFNGYKEWTKITNEPPVQLQEDMVEFEIVGQQFAWSVRYPGKDKVVGNHYFRDIDASNSFGIKPTDENGWDDFAVRKIYLPVNKLTHVRIRAKDVLHSVYMPHFRVKMDAVPGMPTDFWFTPTKTSYEMRQELGNQDFNYEVACTEMCGKGHFSMRFLVEVVEEDVYNEWLEKESKNAWTLKDPAEYVYSKLQAQGASDELISKFISFVKSNNEEAYTALLKFIGENTNGTELGESLKSELTKSLSTSVSGDSTSVSTSDSTLTDSSMVDSDAPALSIDNADTEEGKKKKNLLHKIGDKVEDHRENRAEKKGEEYEKKDNKLHQLGDKVEENN